MVRKSAFFVTSAVMAMLPTAAYPATAGFNLRVQVPVQCSVRHEATGYGGKIGAAVSLGRFREFCNAPGGYELVVSYTPGTLQGATISAGDEQVVLTGSGQAVLSRETGPKIRERTIFATPGAGGFDTDRLDFQIIPIA